MPKIGLLLCLSGVILVGGAVMAGLTAHPDEEDSPHMERTPGPTTVALASMVAGAQGTMPSLVYSAATPDDLVEHYALVWAWDGTVLEDSASDYIEDVSTATYQWQADVEFPVDGAIWIEDYVPPTSLPTTYAIELRFGVEFFDFGLTWPFWEQYQSDIRDIYIVNEDEDPISETAFKRVVDSLDQTDYIKVGFIVGGKGEAEISRSDPKVHGKMDLAVDYRHGGWVKLVEYNWPSPPVVHKVWDLP